MPLQPRALRHIGARRQRSCLQIVQLDDCGVAGCFCHRPVLHAHQTALHCSAFEGNSGKHQWGAGKHWADTVAQEVVLANFANGSISLDCHLLDQVEEKFAAIHSAQRFHLVAEMLHLAGCTGVHPEGLKAVKLALATVLLPPAKGKLQETKCYYCKTLLFGFFDFFWPAHLPHCMLNTSSSLIFHSSGKLQGHVFIAIGVDNLAAKEVSNLHPTIIRRSSTRAILCPCDGSSHFEWQMAAGVLWRFRCKNSSCLATEVYTGSCINLVHNAGLMWVALGLVQEFEVFISATMQLVPA